MTEYYDIVFCIVLHTLLYPSPSQVLSTSDFLHELTATFPKKSNEGYQAFLLSRLCKVLSEEIKAFYQHYEKQHRHAHNNKVYENIGRLIIEVDLFRSKVGLPLCDLLAGVKLDMGMKADTTASIGKPHSLEYHGDQESRLGKPRFWYLQ